MRSAFQVGQEGCRLGVGEGGRRGGGVAGGEYSKEKEEGDKAALVNEGVKEGGEEPVAAEEGVEDPIAAKEGEEGENVG